MIFANIDIHWSYRLKAPLHLLNNKDKIILEQTLHRTHFIVQSYIIQTFDYNFNETFFTN